jgi:hypothetical protein
MKKILFIISVILSSVFFKAQNWNQIIKLVASDRAQADYFGISVDIDGDYAVVGSYYDDEDESGNNYILNSGSVYVFKLTAGVWTQQQKIVASDREAGNNFGRSVAIDKEYIVVSTISESEDANGNNTIASAGAAYIFKLENDIWTQKQKIVASDRQDGDYFGWSVAISENHIVVGAYAEDHDENGQNLLSNAGSAYIFELSNGIWTQQKKIVASDRESGQRFGCSLAIDGDYIIVGAYSDDISSTFTDVGAAYIYKSENGNWIEKQKIMASDYDGMDYFGWSVDIENDHIIVGAYNESQDTSGANTMSSSGSTYVFKLGNDGIWTQKQKLIASDRAEGDHFGYNVKISGDKILIGANWEDEDSSGANTVLNAGSAYIFEYVTSNDIWIQKNKIVPSDRIASDNFGAVLAINGNNIIASNYNNATNASGGNSLTRAGAAYMFKYTTEETLGVNDLKYKNITVYPNPTSGQLFVKSDKKIKSLELYNVEGRKILMSDKNSANLSSLSIGSYLLKVKYGDGSVESKKIIKK